MIFSLSKRARGCKNLLSPRVNEVSVRATPTRQNMKPSAIVLPCLALALLSSCASVSVKTEKRNSHQPTQKPAKIYVSNFGTQHCVFNIAGSESKNPEAFKKKTAETLANYLTTGINKHVAAAQRASSATGLPKNGWL